MNWIVVYAVANELRNFSLSSFLSFNAYLLFVGQRYYHILWSILIGFLLLELENNFNIHFVWYRSYRLVYMKFSKKYDARNGFIAFSRHSQKKINANKSKPKSLARCISTELSEWSKCQHPPRKRPKNSYNNQHYWLENSTNME